MSTPQRKGYLALSLTPRSEVPRSAAAKGKAIAGPPLGLLGDNGPAGGRGGEGLEDWRRFREAGLLDEAAMERRDRQALADRVSKLQSEVCWGNFLNFFGGLVYCRVCIYISGCGQRAV